MVKSDRQPWEQVGIRKSWYYYIRSRSRTPSLRLALEIYDRLGDKFGSLTGLTSAEIDVMRKALHKSGGPIDMASGKQLQIDDGELRRDSPRDDHRPEGDGPETNTGGTVSR